MGVFPAMGTEVTVLAPTVALSAEEVLTQHVALLFDQTERVFSRFRPDSMLSALNRSHAPFKVPEAMFSLLSRARGYNRLTRGLFDPTIGAALSASGYDESFVPGALDRPTARASAARRSPGFGGLRLDSVARTVTRAADMQLDLGGIVKGYAVDCASRMLPACSAVDAGGDAFLGGDGPDGTGWLVDIEDPSDASRTVLTLRVRDSGVATSAPNRRHWRLGDRRMHHLIDPRSGEPAETDLAQATVVAPRAELADVLAKTAFLLGLRGARDFLSQMHAVGGVLIGRHGDVECVGRLEVESG